MLTVTIPRLGHQSEFAVVAEPFLQSPGLPFAHVLDAESLRRVFHEESCASR